VYQARLVLSEAEVKDIPNLRNVAIQLNINNLDENSLKIGNI
jgi:hypothetical protein